MITYDDVQEYYDSMLSLWVNNEQNEITINNINNSLSNWHSVGVYLTHMQRQFDAQLFEQEQKSESLINACYLQVHNELKALMPPSQQPTQRLIDSIITQKFGDEVGTMKLFVFKCKNDCESLQNLRKMHDKFVAVLKTLSDNLRTDFVYEGHIALTDEADQKYLGHTGGVGKTKQQIPSVKRNQGPLTQSDIDFVQQLTNKE